MGLKNTLRKTLTKDRTRRNGNRLSKKIIGWCLLNNKWNESECFTGNAWRAYYTQSLWEDKKKKASSGFALALAAYDEVNKAAHFIEIYLFIQKFNARSRMFHFHIIILNCLCIISIILCWYLFLYIFLSIHVNCTLCFTRERNSSSNKWFPCNFMFELITNSQT